MSERKNLDKLFQEKFKDFEATAPEESWRHIEERLKEKKKRRVIPIWWKLSGIAAALLIGLALADGFFDRGTTKSQPVVVETPRNSENVHPIRGKDSIETDLANSENGNQSAPDSVYEMSHDKKSAVAVNASVDLNPTQNPHSNGEAVAEVPKLGTSEKRTVKNIPKGNAQQVATNNNASHEDGNSATEKRTFKSASKNQRIAENGSSKSKNKSALLNGSGNKNPDVFPNPKTNSTLNNVYATENDRDASGSKIALQKANQETAVPDDKNNGQSQNNNQPIAVNEMTNAGKDQQKKLDSTAIATVVPNALEELLNEKENNLVTKEPKINRWQITSSVAPIYFGSTSGGSPIDSTFSSNSKNYKTNMSVKLGVNYAVSKKFTIRAGISQVTLDYNTNDVLISASMNRNTLGNIDTNGQNQFLHFARKSAAERTASTMDAATSGSLLSDQFASSLNQRMGYLEVPVEVSYAVFDKKFGLNIIGGISTLFLNENKIILISDGLTTNLGEANNLNKTHFSTNIGLGLRYRFYRALQANFEPMFKYQINTFSKEDGNFKPYFLGLYTGISYSF